MRPDTPEQAAELLRSLGEEGRPVHPRGGGTKDWGPVIEDAAVVETGGLARILEHNVGDFTAVLEAGVPLARAQAEFAEHGQMLAIDPAPHDAATVGGVMAANDSGPLRHRYGSMRDLVVGTTVALSDGTLARSGGKVIKNVAGYDLGKLFTGSFGTLGLIVRVAVRLHPLPAGQRQRDRRAPATRSCSARRQERWPLDRSRPTAWTSTGATARGGCWCASAAPPRATRPPRPSSR